MVVKVDNLIIGGGITGLMLLEYLKHETSGTTILVERTACGTGQSIASQGIIHMGWKYLLDDTIPQGAEKMELSGSYLRNAVSYLTGQRKDVLYLWGHTENSWRRIERACWRMQANPKYPTAMYDVRAMGRFPFVADTEETVVSMPSLLKSLLDKHRGRVWRGEAVVDGNLTVVTDRVTGATVEVDAGHRIWCSGAGLDAAGYTTVRRPVHMGMVSGILPVFNGHYVEDGVDGPSITITTVANNTWLIGGRVAEKVGHDLTVYREAVRRALPALNLNGLRWSSFDVDRVELPREQWALEPQVVVNGKDIVATPTKMAMVYGLCWKVLEAIGGSGGRSHLPDWPSPEVTTPPWEEPRAWETLR